MFKKLWKKLDDYFSLDERKRIKVLLKHNEKLALSIVDLNKVIVEKDKDLILSELKLQESELELYDVVHAVDEEEELEHYWNNKRNKDDRYLYSARPVLRGDKCVPVNPRMFFTLDSTLPTIAGKTNDEKAKNSLNYVIRRIKYVSDTTNFKLSESWLFPFETIKLKKGDCEDGAILLANLMLANGIPYWRIRLNAGTVQGGGHAYVTYLKEEDNKWYVLDWCYWPDDSIDFKKTWKSAKKYFGIWFSFNTKYLFRGDKLDR